MAKNSPELPVAGPIRIATGIFLSVAWHFGVIEVRIAVSRRKLLSLSI